MTIAHGLCGYAAIVLLVRRRHAHSSSPGVTVGDLRLAGTLVSAGAVLDVLDGPVARRFGSSGLGDLLDGMCDTVTFGVVPAAAVAASSSTVSTPANWALTGAGGAYLTAMILRLVRSEMTPADELKRGFQGLPSAPASGAALSAVALNAPPPVTCLLVVTVAALTVGDYHYPRQRPAVLPIIAGGPAIGLLGIWGILPRRPALIVTMVSTIALPVGAASAAWRRRRTHARAT